MEPLTLFCIPYAGGSATIYSVWKKYIQQDITIVPLELSGRGRRMKEAYYENMEAAVDDLYAAIKGQVNGPYAIFGHSMGSLIAYELLRKLMRQGDPFPVHAILSGRKPPNLTVIEKIVNNLPEEEFIVEVLRFGGATPQLFENEHLRKLFLPILRADFKLLETYNYERHVDKLPCDLSVFTGKDDENLTWEEAKAWEVYTTGTCKTHSFQGGHFYLNEVTEQVVQQLSRTLRVRNAVSEMGGR